jgi:hypothetical protein
VNKYIFQENECLILNNYNSTDYERSRRLVLRTVNLARNRIDRAKFHRGCIILCAEPSPFSLGVQAEMVSPTMLKWRLTKMIVPDVAIEFV